ncbi:hypothetical protein Dimus_002439 [Dionaea muscipula]
MIFVHCARIEEAESHSHLFFKCSFVQHVLVVINCEAPIGWRWKTWSECVDWIKRNAAGKTRRARGARIILGTIIQGIWWERNRRVFLQKNSDYMDTAYRILRLYKDYSR